MWQRPRIAGWDSFGHLGFDFKAISKERKASLPPDICRAIGDYVTGSRLRGPDGL